MLCTSCSKIDVKSLLRALPVPAYPRGGGCGVPNFFEFKIPEPLIFANIDECGTTGDCSLCSLLLRREDAVQGFSKAASKRPLQLAGLCPPSKYAYETSTFNWLESPQWHDFKDDEQRINTLEPVTETSGSLIKPDRIYPIYSAWQVNVAADEGSHASQYITRRPLSKQSSDQSFDLLARTIAECNQGHDKCKLGVDGLRLPELPQLPSRVIDVGSDTQIPHLVETHGRSGQYVTLSHCWGSQRWVATTKKTLPLMLDGFYLEDIPRTYADAILVTRKLGCQYLWIDSFCIVQDDQYDWRAESERMGDIYEKAYCNIAATGAEDGNTGFLHTRKAEPEYVRVPADPASEDYLYFTTQANSSFCSQVRRAKLLTRGWVMQERVLSRRTIHFAADMWYWECGQHILSEDGWRHDFAFEGNETTPSLRASLEDATMAIGKVFQAADKPVPPNGKDVTITAPTEILWAQILRAYSRCQLTFWSDKMPALQGLANRFEDITKAKYYAGHWITNYEPLPLSLMWYAADDGGMQFSESQSAPSWSCLKANGPLGFHDCRGATPTTRMDTIDGGKDAQILLRGRIRAAKLSMPNGENPGSMPTFYSMSFQNKTAYGTFTNTLGPARFDDAANVPKDFALLLTFEKMPYSYKGNVYTNSQKDQLALVLQEVEPANVSLDRFGAAKRGVKRYRRIGIANVNNHNFFANEPFSEAILI